jgi:hypothetical protein
MTMILSIGFPAFSVSGIPGSNALVGIFTMTACQS